MYAQVGSISLPSSRRGEWGGMQAPRVGDVALKGAAPFGAALKRRSPERKMQHQKRSKDAPANGGGGREGQRADVNPCTENAAPKGAALKGAALKGAAPKGAALKVKPQKVQPQKVQPQKLLHSTARLPHPANSKHPKSPQKPVQPQRRPPGNANTGITGMPGRGGHRRPLSGSSSALSSPARRIKDANRN